MPVLPNSFSTHATAFLFAAYSAVLIGFSPASAHGRGDQTARRQTPEGPRHSIERLYSLPSLIGTAPSGFTWSEDGRYLAFLWNNEGYNFRDVWVVDTQDTELEPVRLTHLPPLEIEADSDPFENAKAVERMEHDPGVTSVHWHPKGQWLLISFRGDLWRIDRENPPLRLTATAAFETQAAFSPDGSLLAFIRGGDLWTLSAQTGLAPSPALPAQRTTIATQGDDRVDVRIDRFAWSADNRTVAVLETDRRGVTLRGIPDYLSEDTKLSLVRRAYPGEESSRQRIGLLDISTRKQAVRWLSLADNAPDLLLSFAWSPDGSSLAIDTSDFFAKDRRIFLVDVASPGDQAPKRAKKSSKASIKARLLARDADPENETFYFWRIAWSTDSQRLYFLSDRDEDYHVYAVSPSSPRTPVRLTHGAWAVAEIHPIAGGLIAVGNRGKAEERQLFRIDDHGAEPIRRSRRPGTHSPVVSPDSRYAAVSFSSDDTPPDLFLTALEGPPDAAHSERRVTHSPIPAFDEHRWVTPRYVTFPSHIDGTTLHGRLTLPPDFDPNRRYPAILGSIYTDSVRNQWGGRTAHPTWGLDQFLAQEGYILLNVDMRGSWGRGRDHRRGIRLDYGGIDIEDLESGVRFLTSLGSVDDKRVGIWGSSYGGLMTAMSLFRKPGLYAAGVAGAPATNVWHALPGQMAVMMRPQDEGAAYADSSPFSHGQGLEDPLMIIHGMRDPVVLFKDSVTLVERLIQLGKDVDLVALPNAGHGWDNEGLAQTRFAFRKLIQHFDRHLKGSASFADMSVQGR